VYLTSFVVIYIRRKIQLFFCFWHTKVLMLYEPKIFMCLLSTCKRFSWFLFLASWTHRGVWSSCWCLLVRTSISTLLIWLHSSNIWMVSIFTEWRHLKLGRSYKKGSLTIELMMDWIFFTCLALLQTNIHLFFHWKSFELFLSLNTNILKIFFN